MSPCLNYEIQSTCIHSITNSIELNFVSPLNNVHNQSLSVFVLGSSQVENCGEMVHMLSKFPSLDQYSLKIRMEELSWQEEYYCCQKYKDKDS